MKGTIMNSKGQPGFLPKGFATMNPLAWWIDYCVGAVSTSASRFEMWGLLLLKKPLETLAEQGKAPDPK